MVESFDPYHSWLAIPKVDQPPHHYRLLALNLFEADPDVISHAADQRMSHLRTFQAGKHGALSQRLLNEVAAARICLLSPKKKEAYDIKLRKQLANQSAPGSESAAAELGDALEKAQSPKTPASAARSFSRRQIRLIIGLGAVVVLAGAALIAWLAMPGENQQIVARPDPRIIEQSTGLKEPPPAAPITEKPSARIELPPAAGSNPKTSESTKPPEVRSPEAVAATKPPREASKPPASEAKREETKPAVAPAVAAAPSDSRLPPPSPKPETVPAVTPKKPPPPDAPALEQAKKAAGDLFKADVEKAKTSTAKIALAKRLLSQVQEQSGLADRYALLLMAQDLAMAARDAETAFLAVDQAAEAFDVDPLARKTEILAAWTKEARTADARKWVVEQLLTLGEAAIDAGQLEAAKELGRLATGKASGLRDVAPKLKAYRQRFIEAGNDAEELKAAQAALAKDPKDPRANLVMGQYVCFTKGNWPSGLALLALGSDPTLKALAEQELSAAVAQSNEQVALADAWWEIASARRRSQTNTIKLHAGLWYQRTAGSLPSGLVKTKVEQRLREVAKLRSQLSPPPLAAAPFDEKQARQYQQRWADYLGETVELANSIGMKLALIPPGEFDMGAAPEQLQWTQANLRKNNAADYQMRHALGQTPQHRVRLTIPYRVGIYEVTQAEYERVMGNNPSAYSAKGKYAERFVGQDTGRYPVENVTWEQAGDFCRRLSALPAEREANRQYRLPSEAEWEHACRSGTGSRWYFGDDESQLGQYVWFAENAKGSTKPVGQKKPNRWGLYDMLGNVNEWCLDAYSNDFYRISPTIDPVNAGTSRDHVLRGGRGPYGEPWLVTSFWRHVTPFQLGFRVVCVIEAAAKR